VDRYTVGRFAVDRYFSDTNAGGQQHPSSSRSHHSSNNSVGSNYDNSNASSTRYAQLVDHEYQASSRQLHHRLTNNNRQDYDHDTDRFHHSSKDAMLGEMQVKLDIAAAQLLTEEMKMKDISEQFESERRILKEKIRAMERERQAYRSKLDEMQWQFESVLRVTEQESSSMIQHQGEIEELRLEIGRLHEAFREEKNLLLSDYDALRVQYQEELQQMENRYDQENEQKFKELIVSLESRYKVQIKELKSSFDGQLEQLQERLQQSDTEKERLLEEYSTMKQKLEEKDKLVASITQEYKQSKEEVQNLSKDFQDLAEEAERLEKELESVSEDRDELLRQRSPQALHHDGGREILQSFNEEKKVNGSDHQTLLADRDKKILALEGQVHQMKEEHLRNQSLNEELQQLLTLNENISTVTVLKDQLSNTKKERDELKQCLMEAMQKVEHLEKVNENGKRPLTDDKTISHTRQHVLLLIQWIKKRFNKAIKDGKNVHNEAPDDENDRGGDFLGDIDLSSDDPEISTLFEYIKMLCDDKITLENKLRLLSRELDDDDGTSADVSDPLDKENESDARVKRLKANLASSKKAAILKDEANAELRSTLKDAVDLIKPLKEQVSRLEDEKKQLQIELKTATERVTLLDRELALARQKMSRTGISSESSSYESENGEIDVDLLLSQLQQKDDSLTDLKIEVAQLRDEIKSNSTDNSTLTGYNKLTPSSKDKRDGMGREMLQVDIEQLKNDLIKYQISERTLKALLQHTTSLLNAELLKKVITSTQSTISDSMIPQDSGSMCASLQKELETARARIVELTKEMSTLRDQLRTSQLNEKKLSFSLNEAVDLLKPLQSQIEKVERDKKELQNKLSEARTVMEDRDLGNDVDYTNSRISKGDYEKTINQLNQYVGELEAEVTKLEGKILLLNESSSKDDMRIRLLEKEIATLREEYEATKLMLKDVTATNRSLLNDLRQSEAEELEVIEEFSEAQDMLRAAQDEIENAKFIASSLITKMDEINFRDNASNASARSTASGKMRTLTACFRALEDQVRIAAERNIALENQLSMKNRLISDVMGHHRR